MDYTLCPKCGAYWECDCRAQTPEITEQEIQELLALSRALADSNAGGFRLSSRNHVERPYSAPLPDRFTARVDGHTYDFTKQ